MLYSYQTIHYECLITNIIDNTTPEIVDNVD